MKKLDRLIQNTVITILVVTFLVIAITNIELAKNIILFVIFMAYLIFFTAHIFLLMPFVMLLIVISDYIQETNFYTKIKTVSDFLGWCTIAIPSAVVVVIVYWLIPVLTCMLHLETLNIGDGIEQLSKIIRK